MHKNSILLGIGFSMCILFAGCGSASNQSSSTKQNSMTEVPKSDWPQTISVASREKVAVSQENEIYVDNYMLYFGNLKTNQFERLCGKKGCEHPAVVKDGLCVGSSCEAAPANGAYDYAAIGIHGDTIFEYTQNPETANTNQTDLYLRKVGQTKRKKVATLPCEMAGIQTDMYYVGNQVYFFGHEYGNSKTNIKEEGAQGDYHTRLYRMDLDTYEITALAGFSSKQNYQGVDHFQYQDKKLIFTTFWTNRNNKMGSQKMNFKSIVYVYDLELDTLTKLENYNSKTCYYIGYEQGNIYYLDYETRQIVQESITSKEKVKLATIKKAEDIANAEIYTGYGLLYETYNIKHKDRIEENKDYFYCFQTKQIRKVAYYSKSDMSEEQTLIIPVLIVDDVVIFQEVANLDEDSISTKMISVPVEEYVK